MCGVCGVIRPSGPTAADAAAVAELNRRQWRRGPDATVSARTDGAVLGHTRLAIVDLSEQGRQPFTSADGAVTVVFNGEIYNHEELRSRHRLTTGGRCDGAILPDLWQRMGPAALAELRGMYAIAVHDARDGAVTLARDPFGIKPLYWTWAPDGGLAFASEPRCLLRFRSRPRLSEEALRHYLRFGAISRDSSPFDGVEAVPANGWVRWDRLLRHSSGPIQPGLFDELRSLPPRTLRTAFLESVSAHLSSDVPVALLLSSGLDSAAVAWACRELGTRLSCITVDMGLGSSERAGAAGIAARFGHDHDVVSVAPDSGLLWRYFAAMQRPSIDGLNTFLVSQAVAGAGMKVALSGLGGDEVLAGYPAFRLLRYLPLLRGADAVGLTPLLGRLYPGTNWKLVQLFDRDGPRHAAGLAALVRRVLMEEQVADLTGARGSAEPSGSADASGRPTCLASARALTIAELYGYLGGTLLADADTFSMAWSVELRVPYVDVRFVRAAVSAAPRWGVGKPGFAAALGEAELRRVAGRRKRGFTLPMDWWMRHGPLAPLVAGAQAEDAPVRQLLRADAVDRLLSGWREGRLRWSRAWLLVSLDAWLRSLGSELTPPGGAASQSANSHTPPASARRSR